MLLFEGDVYSGLQRCCFRRGTNKSELLGVAGLSGAFKPKRKQTAPVSNTFEQVLVPYASTYGRTSMMLRILFSILGLALLAKSQVPCDSDEFCQELLNSQNTVCLEESKTCSNPFRRGCLNTMLDKPVRVCNSDDPEGSPDCNKPQFEIYPEMRIHNANWESSVVQAWMYQIVLMEFAQVPATVGLTTGATLASGFYSEEFQFAPSPIAYPYAALIKANSLAQDFLGGVQRDCSETTDECADVFPEVWDGQAVDYLTLFQNETIRIAANGLLGHSGFHIPTRTAKEFPELAIWYGLAGEEKREFLAETFLRPLTWLEYCNDVSTSECLNATDIAARFPTQEEENLYFADGLFTGHFAANEENNCTMNPTTCTGHIVVPPCDWSSAIDAQLFWNDIVGLQSSGPLQPNGGYSQDAMIQIWSAANATKNHVIMHWYEPEPVFIRFSGTDYAFQPVAFPPANLQCILNRVQSDDRCSDDATVRRGSIEGSCGNDAEALQRLVVHSLETRDRALPDADRSPSFDVVNNFVLTNLDMSFILQRIGELNRDPFGHDARQALCEWAVANESRLRGYVPLGFPRIRRDRSEYGSWYLIFAQVISATAAFLAFVGFWFVTKYRHTKTLVFAQPVFLHLILFGMCMISIGAFLNAVHPSSGTCTTAAWLLLLGYTIELVPVLVKTNKINKLIRSSRKQKRINISREAMLLEVAQVVVIVIAFLLTWTLVDPPSSEDARTVQIGDGEPGSENYVSVDVRCGSEYDHWRLIAFVWEGMLLILAAFLAFQSRDIMKQLNESVSLAFMVYSHFLFAILRGVLYVFSVQDTMSSSVLAALFSFNYALDTVAAMAIYVVPKIVAARKNPEPYVPGMVSAVGSTLPSEDASHDDIADEHASPKLQVLVASGNLGNAEPEMDSLEAWIPVGGCCDRMDPLEDKTMPTGTFGLIAIGMQEATWAETQGRKSTIKGESISEDEVLSALEEANTAQLRQMIQEILGDRYYMLVGERRGQMRLQIWATRKVVENVTDIKVTGANTGIGNLLSNKGGIVISLTYRQTRLSFASVHLAAHEGESYYKARCDSMRSILKEAKTFEKGAKLDIATASHHCFVFGDLNFRTRFNEEKKYEDNIKLATDLISFKDYASLYAFDELNEGLAKGDFLLGFKTLECDFAPTFKVERQRDYVYKTQRMPSWTDRVLFNSSRGLEENLVPLAYEACPDHITSDHKPIRSAFCLTPNDELGTVNVDTEVTLEFSKLKCSDLQPTSSNGSSDPYVMLVWDEVELQSEKIVGLSFVKRFFGQVWPKTQTIYKSANPYWKGDTISLYLKNTRVSTAGMLFLVVVNHDTYGRMHDILGATAFGVKDLLMIPETASEDQVNFSRELHRDGKFAGNIKFKLDIKRKSVNVNSRRRSSVFGFNKWSRASSQFDRSKLADGEDFSEALKSFQKSAEMEAIKDF